MSNDPYTWRGRPIATIGELFNAVMSCETEADAADLMDAYVARLTAHEIENPVSVAEANVGYVIGYDSDPDRRAAAHALFKANHPVFGATY